MGQRECFPLWKDLDVSDAQVVLLLGTKFKR